MASRQIYLVNNKEPYYRKYTCEFTYYNGFSKAQKQRSIRSLHEAYHKLHSDQKLLEVSRASEDELGMKLSAFNLMVYVPSSGKRIPLECVFQGGKVYEHGGPYLDMYEMRPGDAKKDERKEKSGRIISFEFEGRRFPNEPRTFFYDYLYLRALKENKDVSEKLLEYDGFTDIYFNPEKAENCQAISCAKYVSLMRCGKLDEYLEKQDAIVEAFNKTE